MEQLCYTCKFWGDSFHDKYRDGDCRRHSPISLFSTDRYTSAIPIFPRMNGGDYCGDWEEMKSSQPEGER